MRQLKRQCAGGFLFVVPTVGTWMQSPRYVGFLRSRSGLLFFDKKGAQDPSRYLEETQQAKQRYFDVQQHRGLNVQAGHEAGRNRPSVH